ncbi:MAG TPA: serine/threonine-protein kinase [Candidatus Limnocylindria bacterium]|nr:serine/threonine-protein kinase [Candidatus Limnocylindria bacterium]
MPTIGETLAGRFRIDASLGAGGMATVFRARDLRLERDVAVKVLAPNLAGDKVLSERFDREARALAAISHPNVVTIYDVEPGDPASGREPFFVMELCEGGSLAERLLRAGGHLPPNEVVPIVASIASGLDAVHSAGLVHRDIKPHNVLLAADRARLGDLGLARPGDDAGWDALTTTGMAMGTLAYIAPERLAGEPATPAGDIWSLGAMTYQALTGRLPRAAASVTELAERRLAPSPPPSSVAPDLGTAFDATLLAALDPDPAGRPGPLALGAALVSALGRWSRERGAAMAARGSPSAHAAPPFTPPQSEEPVDSDAATSIYRTPPRSAPPDGRGGTFADRAAIAVIAIGLVGAAVIVLALLTGLRSFNPGVLPPASPSASPSRPPSPSPTSSPSPTPTRDAFAAARARLADVRAAIDAARGSGGLKGKDANELLALANKVGEAIDDRDASEARDAAGKLVEQVRKDIKDGDIGGDRARDLLAAAEALRDAIP